VRSCDVKIGRGKIKYFLEIFFDTIVCHDQKMIKGVFLLFLRIPRAGFILELKWWMDNKLRSGSTSGHATLKSLDQPLLLQYNL
jgi:hypothetical protein